MAEPILGLRAICAVDGCELLGHLRDSPALALSAISYLTRQP